jgi:AbrB family looped-hinge helix DNA binding protein
VNYNYRYLVIHQGDKMRSTITERGQTVIPADIRRRFGLTPSQRIEWIVDSQGIRVVPVAKDAIAAFRGQGKGGATERLMRERAEDWPRE